MIITAEITGKGLESPVGVACLGVARASGCQRTFPGTLGSDSECRATELGRSPGSYIRSYQPWSGHASGGPAAEGQEEDYIDYIKLSNSKDPKVI